MYLHFNINIYFSSMGDLGIGFCAMCVKNWITTQVTINVQISLASPESTRAPVVVLTWPHVPWHWPSLPFIHPLVCLNLTYRNEYKHPSILCFSVTARLHPSPKVMANFFQTQKLTCCPDPICTIFGGCIKRMQLFIFCAKYIDFLH